MDIAAVLIEALLQRGVRRAYGVPGDYVLGLFDRLEHSPIRVICTAGEEGAGFAADAHGRLGGLGVAVVTYGVGALKLLNPVAGAYAERSPLLVISGAPGVREADQHALLHHSIRGFDTQRRLFHEVCAATARLDSGRTAVAEIGKVLTAMRRESRPGYLELPRDCLQRPVPGPLPPLAPAGSDAEVAPWQRQRCLEVLAWLRSRQRPVVLAGIELHRFGLQGALLAVLEREGWPFATSLSAKSLLNERHPLCLGLYEGAAGPEAVRRRVEESDGLLILGMPLADLDTGIFTMPLQPDRVVRVEMDRGLQGPMGEEDSLDPAILLQVWRQAEPPPVGAGSGGPGSSGGSLAPEPPPFVAEPATPVRVRRLVAALQGVIGPDTVVLADPGDALFAAADLRLPAASDFLASGYWASLGFAIPAAIGAWGASAPPLRPLVLVGDGALLMSAIELATLARYRIPALVVVLDNGGYGTERPMLDGPFNDVQPVDHPALAASFGFAAARRVRLEEELATALGALLAVVEGPTLLSVELGREDASDVLRSLTAALAQRVRGPQTPP
jgi:TPP-dependent 2-oxoacid decarboxylase